MEVRRHFPIVDGERLAGQVVEIRSPFDGEGCSLVDQASAAQVEAAISAAARAAPLMREMPAHRRAELLRRMATLMGERAAALATAIRDEAGKPIQYARAEVSRCQQTFNFAAEEAGRLVEENVALDAVAPGAGRFGIIRRFPLGPVAAISPFNFPLNLSAHKVAPAIAAGCPVVLKPASQTPSAPCLMGEIALEAGLPPGALNVVPAPRAAADRLTTDPRLALLTFTGSPEVGWDMKARCGQKHIVLELGGNAAVMVHSDADLEWAAARCAVGAFAYAGQICISVQRIFVHAPVYDRFVEALLAAVRDQVATGDPRDEAVVCGPLISAGDVDRVLDWIGEACGGGARKLCGGERQGSVISPCVLEAVPRESKLGRLEAFGPVVQLDRYRDWDDAIAKVNDSSYGLQAAVFTNDLAGLWRCYEGIDVGGVIHNDASMFRADHMPYGGIKDSGFGREGLRYAIEDMTELKILALYPR